MTTSITFRAQDDIFSGLGIKNSPAAEISAEGFMNIRKYTLPELRGIFNKEELTGLLNTTNGTMFQAEFAANIRMLSISVEDSEHFDHNSELYGYDFQKFFKKIQKLTAAQAFLLLFECWRFWNVENAYATKESSQNNIDIFVDSFI